MFNIFRRADPATRLREKQLAEATIAAAQHQHQAETAQMRADYHRLLAEQEKARIQRLRGELICDACADEWEALSAAQTTDAVHPEPRKFDLPKVDITKLRGIGTALPDPAQMAHAKLKAFNAAQGAAA